jgi:hypothetical protein
VRGIGGGWWRDHGGWRQAELRIARSLSFGRGDWRRHDCHVVHLDAGRRNFVIDGCGSGRNHAGTEFWSGTRLIVGNACRGWTDNFRVQGRWGRSALARNIGGRGDDAGVQSRRDQRVLGTDAGRGRHDARIQNRSGSRFIRRDGGSRWYDGVELESAAGLIATYVSRCRSNHVDGETGSDKR